MVARVLKCCKLLLTYLEQPQGAGAATAADTSSGPEEDKQTWKGITDKYLQVLLAMQKVLTSDQDLKKKGKSNTKTPPLFDSTHTHANTT